MRDIEQNQCEWAVNDAGNVMLALPCFHDNTLDYAYLDGNHLIICYDWFLRARVLIPAPVFPFISEAPTLLLVAFTTVGDIFEIDLQIGNITAP